MGAMRYAKATSALLLLLHYPSIVQLALILKQGKIYLRGEVLFGCFLILV